MLLLRGLYKESPMSMSEPRWPVGILGAQGAWASNLHEGVNATGRHWYQPA